MKDFIQSRKSVPVFLGLHFILWFSIYLQIDLHPDMSDHWVWSRHLAMGYYEHPPMVAWTMHLATLFGSSSVLSLKVGAILFSCLILYLSYRLGKEYYSHETGLLMMLLMELSPYFSAGSFFWHIDQPYLVCWILGMILIGRFIKTKNRNYLLLFGIVAGFGALSKYITLLFYLSLLVWILVDRKYRYLLKNPYTYLAGGLSFLIFSINLYWNATHDWISFKFQFGRGLSEGHWSTPFYYTLTHMFLFGVVFSSMFYFLFLRKKLQDPDDPYRSFLLSMGGFVLLFFTVASSRGSIADPHWVNVSYICFFLLLAKYLANLPKEIKKKVLLRTGIVAFFLNSFLITFIFAQTFIGFLPLSWSEDNTTRILGWNQTSQQIQKILDREKLGKIHFVITREYQLGGALSLYLQDQPFPHAIEKQERNIWSPVPLLKEKGAIMVCTPKECEGTIQKTEARLQQESIYLGKIETVHSWGKTIRQLEIYYFKPLAGL